MILERSTTKKDRFPKRFLECRAGQTCRTCKRIPWSAPCALHPLFRHSNTSTQQYCHDKDRPIDTWCGCSKTTSRLHLYKGKVDVGHVSLCWLECNVQSAKRHWVTAAHKRNQIYVPLAEYRSPETEIWNRQSTYRATRRRNCTSLSTPMWKYRSSATFSALSNFTSSQDSRH